MAYAIKAEVVDPLARTFTFIAQKTMYGGKQITPLTRSSYSRARRRVAKRPMGRRELKHLTNWNDGRPGTELNFKFYRQSTNKIAGISDGAVSFLGKCF